MDEDPRTRRLLLMRHARAAPGGPDDHSRELTERGVRDATEAGRWLAGQSLVPTHALVSSATRTSQTWRAVAAASGSTARAAYDDALFVAGPDAALEVLRAADPEAATLILVGHNPTVAYLAQLVSDGLADAAVLRETTQGYPPCALTAFDVPVPWAELREGTARATAFHVGTG